MARDLEDERAVDLVTDFLRQVVNAPAAASALPQPLPPPQGQPRL